MHGMAYYIFLKSLRSLEEFRKNPHVKIPPKSPSTNFQSLDKFKNPILIQKFLFSDFWPGRPRCPLGLWPSQPTGRAVPAGQNRPVGTSSPRVGRIFVGNTFSSLVQAFLSRPPPPRFSDNRVPAVSSVPHLQPPELARAAIDPWPPSAAQLCTSGAIEPSPPRLHFPSLNSPP
jgi:hypothetical protein